MSLWRLRISIVIALSLASAATLEAMSILHRKHASPSAQVTISAREPGCSADLDGTLAGKTNAQGNLALTDVAASEHYVHIDCPGKPERTVFVTLQAGQQLDIRPESSSHGGPSALELAENRLEVRQLLVQAVDLRGDGRFPQTVTDLRRAVNLDPENPNLHHELATTFLMVGDWDDARIELLETLRHDPDDADAHNALGFAYEKLGDIRPALDQYRIATHLDPGDDSYQRHYLEALALLPAGHTHKKKRF
ncbi:MAG TPA: tetratricopeptide repeat protein [Terriglobia bacterium]|nr:tetratricopeptide repeat protein [Terriglobia bacterium]